MIRHPNADLARKTWEAISSGDVDAVTGTLSEDIVWHVATPGRFAGDHVGLEKALEYLASIGELVDEFDARLVDVLVSEDRALLLCRVRAQREGKQLDMDFQFLARLQDDRIVELWTLPHDPGAAGAFWA
ncbi:MAG: nuclear transport factor 2 family protein [Proteobacteria bacterium]|nr:nuclear transport factor 2 family protein [Pseudomonadota bacterium]